MADASVALSTEQVQGFSALITARIANKMTEAEFAEGMARANEQLLPEQVAAAKNVIDELSYFAMQERSKSVIETMNRELSEGTITMEKYRVKMDQITSFMRAYNAEAIRVTRTSKA